MQGIQTIYRKQCLVNKPSITKYTLKHTGFSTSRSSSRTTVLEGRQQGGTLVMTNVDLSNNKDPRIISALSGKAASAREQTSLEIQLALPAVTMSKVQFKPTDQRYYCTSLRVVVKSRGVSSVAGARHDFGQDRGYPAIHIRKYDGSTTRLYTDR
jgi:hypothetical protein